MNDLYEVPTIENDVPDAAQRPTRRRGVLAAAVALLGIVAVGALVVMSAGGSDGDSDEDASQGSDAPLVELTAGELPQGFPDPCNSMTAEEISAVLGEPFAEGSLFPQAFAQSGSDVMGSATCSWTAVDGLPNVHVVIVKGSGTAEAQASTWVDSGVASEFRTLELDRTAFAAAIDDVGFVFADFEGSKMTVNVESGGDLQPVDPEILNGLAELLVDQRIR
jgi:hypothetical protein